MFNKDIKVLKNYTSPDDDMMLYEETFQVSQFLEKSNNFMKTMYSYCSEEQEEDLFVEVLELQDFIGEMYYNMIRKNAIITFPNIQYFYDLFNKKTNMNKLLVKLIKTLMKVNKENEKNAIKVGLEYNI